MSTCPVTRTTALPFDDAPGAWVGLRGLRTGPSAQVWPAPENEQSSALVLPRTVAPASRRRVTTVASTSGMKPSSSRLPFIIGTPATQIASFTPTVLPASGPSGAPSISQRQYQPLKGLSFASGR